MQQQIQNVVNLPIYIDQIIDSSVASSTSICLLVLRPAITHGNSSSHPHKIGVLQAWICSDYSQFNNYCGELTASVLAGNRLVKVNKPAGTALGCGAILV